MTPSPSTPTAPAPVLNEFDVETGTIAVEMAEGFTAHFDVEPEEGGTEFWEITLKRFELRTPLGVVVVSGDEDCYFQMHSSAAWDKAWEALNESLTYPENREYRERMARAGCL